MVTVLACASMLFSTNSAMALRGLACDSAMIRMAFQSSPILSLPLSDSFDLAALVFATMARSPRSCLEGRVKCSAPALSHSLYRGGCLPGKGGTRKNGILDRQLGGRIDFSEP